MNHIDQNSLLFTIRNLPLRAGFLCFKEIIKQEFLIKTIIFREKFSISQSVGKRLHSVFYWTIIGWYKAFCNNIEKVQKVRI